MKVDGTAVEITFKSDVNVNERGFKISYQSYGMFHGGHPGGPWVSTEATSFSGLFAYR